MDASVVYITAKDRDEAMHIASALVSERLVACTNLLDAVTSLYWWDDAVQTGNEVVLISKTRSENVYRAIRRVKELRVD